MIALVLAAVLSADSTPATTTVHVESPIELGFFQLTDETKDVHQDVVLSTIITHRQGKPMCVAPCTVDVPREVRRGFCGASPRPGFLGDRMDRDMGNRPPNSERRRSSPLTGAVRTRHPA